ncbi:MAG: signal recognition particle-docking protein FtsY [Candidatus Bathyarchaeota archaeon]|nr:MAG: signal recognition particle-docking protein FtsY [Candidatus Bathyarchaeota archaeon]
MFERLKQGVNRIINAISKTEFNNEKLDAILWDFKLALLENDVALIVVDQICENVKQKLRGVEIGRLDDKKKIVKRILNEVLYEILQTNENIDLLDLVSKKRMAKEPFIIVFVGVNGTGKTTTIAKIAKLLLSNGYSVVLAASDTYRAGSIEQLESHAKRLGIRMVKHTYGSDAAAVAFDAINHAIASGINAVLVDTAGRMQTNRNLMFEMQKIVKVTDPDLVVFVGDALTGNDAVNQAEEFNKYIKIDASILTKIDADSKGGASISIAYVTKKPTMYLGIGQSYDDLEQFNPNFLIEKILA